MRVVVSVGLMASEKDDSKAVHLVADLVEMMGANLVEVWVEMLGLLRVKMTVDWMAA